jgi:polyribonucleotide nucleotidyltransferase
MMRTAYIAERKLGEPVFRYETGRLAAQADGAVLAQVGETTILVAATASQSARAGADFFPLTVDYEERMYAAGKIPGGFFRREGRPTERAILTARLIDRPLRPCFSKDLRNEVHIVAIVKAVDQENPPDVCAVNAASAALMVSGIPFDGPVGAVRVAHVDGRWVANPTFQEIEQSTFEMVVAGKRNLSGEADILMVEAGATETVSALVAEGAPEPDETLVAQGLEESKHWILEAIALQEELVNAAGVREQTKTWVLAPEYTDEIYRRVSDLAKDRVAKALTLAVKAEREAVMEEIATDVLDSFGEEAEELEEEVRASLRSLFKTMARERIVREGARIDGRKPDEIRPISCDVSVLPRIHGSGLFNRGETQVLSAVTLGMPKMEQMLDDLGIAESKRYMHHYNFPPFSTGETGFMRGPKRREIGHGALAERALLPVIPSEEEFPYALRVVSEVLSSNGSTSMASVCGSTLALMDAGVPLRGPVAGIAMGLIREGDDFVTLTDILGAEDNWGDMDFKVAGTKTMVTALQLDTKITGIPSQVLADAMRQATEARLFILEKMAEALPSPRPEVNPNAPRILAFKIPVDKIGEVIGPKGKRINEIVAATGVEVDIEDDGTVRIGSRESGAADEARRRIEEYANPRMPEVGERFQGKVVKIVDFGAFVSLTPTKDGLVHISKLGGDIRLRHAGDVLEEGEMLEVEVSDIDPMGKISLVPVTVPPKVAELPPDYAQAEVRGPRDRGDRGDRGDRPRPRGDRRDRGDRGGGRDRDRRPRRSREDGERRDGG